MGAAKLSLSPVKRHDGNTAKTQHDGSVEPRINNDRAPPVRLQGGGDLCANGATTAIRLPKEGTTIGTWNTRSLYSCGKYRSSPMS